QQRWWTGQEPERQAERDADERCRQRLCPGPGEPVIKDVSGRADDKSHRRPQHYPKPALDQPAEECLLDRAVDTVEGGLKCSVVDSGRNIESAPAPGEA